MPSEPECNSQTSYRRLLGPRSLMPSPRPRVLSHAVSDDQVRIIMRRCSDKSGFVDRCPSLERRAMSSHPNVPICTLAIAVAPHSHPVPAFRFLLGRRGNVLHTRLRPARSEIFELRRGSCDTDDRKSFVEHRSFGRSLRTIERLPNPAGERRHDLVARSSPFLNRIRFLVRSFPRSFQHVYRLKHSFFPSSSPLVRS